MNPQAILAQTKRLHEELAFYEVLDAETARTLYELSIPKFFAKTKELYKNVPKENVPLEPAYKRALEDIMEARYCLRKCLETLEEDFGFTGFEPEPL